MKPNLFALASLLGPYIPPGASDIRFANVAYRRTDRPAASVRTLRGGARMVLDPSEWPQAQAWVLGRYDHSTVQFIVDQLPRRDGVFFDVGAHVGLISCQVAAVRPGVSVHGFEPHPRVADVYRKNVELNGAAAVLVQAAASDTQGTVSFSLDSHAIGEGQVTIPTIRLDDYIENQRIERIDVMKLDVEGHELEALEGARGALEAGVIRAVTMESMDAHGKDVAAPAALLGSCGFERRLMPDSRPAWIRRIKAHHSANVGYLKSRDQ